jgi:hypothetical protein
MSTGAVLVGQSVYGALRARPAAFSGRAGYCAPTGTYLKCLEGCLSCSQRELFAASWTRYLKWCVRCSRCSCDADRQVKANGLRFTLRREVQSVAVTGQEGSCSGRPGRHAGHRVVRSASKSAWAANSMILAVVSEIVAGNHGDDMTDPLTTLDRRSGSCVDYMPPTGAPGHSSLSAPDLR